MVLSPTPRAETEWHIECIRSLQVNRIRSQPMDVLNSQMFTLRAKADPAPRTFKRSWLLSRTTTCPRKSDSVLSLVADAPSRWRAMVRGIAMVVFGVCLLKIQIPFPQNMAPCRQYEETMLVEAGAVADLKPEGKRCPARRCHAISTEFRSAVEKAAPAPGPASRVPKGSLPKPARDVLPQHGAPEGIQGAHNDGLFAIAGKFVGTCDTEISARVEVIVKVSLGRSEARRVPTTSE